ncbi:MAG TPA: acyl-CoA dehydrogenase family protein [Calditrichia bacterium]|nr:acyl-CoA dehydrogenase family protein [Calditrichia bacterium]
MFSMDPGPTAYRGDGQVIAAGLSPNTVYLAIKTKISAKGTTLDFEWNEQQNAFYEKVVAFARTELSDDVVQRDSQQVFNRDLWRKCADFGLLGLSIPEAYGGSEKEVMTILRAMEGLGYGCPDNGLTFAINAHIWTSQLPIFQFGSEAQRQKYLPAMCRGELIGADAFTEPEAGSDVFSLQTHAKKVDGGYLLNGRKSYITFGPVADVVVLFANTAPEKGKWGITAFLIEKYFPGFTRTPLRDKMGMRTVPMGDLILEDCFVPEENRLGREGAGISISQSALEWERCFILASQLGAMQRQLDGAVQYARERRQFNQPIGKFQSVSNRIADMKVRLETARLMLYKVGWLKSQNRSAMMEAAILKLFLSEAFVESSLDAIRINGGRGYVSEFGVERQLRDAMGGVIYGGTSDIQRNIISRLLGL